MKDERKFMSKFQIVSFSGGKDSTAMLLMMIDRGETIDDIIFFDGGWEFPQMYEHIRKVEYFIGRKITILRPEHDFDYYLLEHEYIMRGKQKGKHNKGYGFPFFGSRWCTRIKCETIQAHIRKIGKDVLSCIGIAADENKRVREDKRKRYPLVEYGMKEKDCVDYCKARGFDWSGLYDHFKRVSCYCCPLQRKQSLYSLYKNHKDLWNELKLKQQKVLDNCETVLPNDCFDYPLTVFDLEEIFKVKDTQQMLF